MATRATAKTAFCNLTPPRSVRLSRSSIARRPAPLAPAIYKKDVSPLALIDAHYFLIRPATTFISRRSLFNLAAAAVSQAARGTGGPQQTLTTVRTLPYAASDLFRIIADVDAYAQFLPHCTVSRVTHWRKSPAPASASWPARADLTVGWGPLSQTYSSRVYCVPGHGVVEAVSGRAGAPTLTAAERTEIGLGRTEDEDGRRLGAETATEDDTFESLVTRWKVKEESSSTSTTLNTTSSRVELHIRFQFRNPIYQIAAAQVGNEMATKMIEAFETRAAALLGRPKARQI